MKSLLLAIKSIKPKDLFLIFAGSMLYVLSIKFFVTPNHLYNSGFMGDFSEKTGIQKLEKGQTFHAEYSITIH